MGNKAVYEIALDPVPPIGLGTQNKHVYVICKKLNNPNDAIINYRQAYPNDHSIFLHARELKGACVYDNSPI